VSWTNAFNAGPCTVTAYLSSDLLHAAAMGKGDSVTVDMSAYELPALTLAVSAEGVVSASCDSQIAGNKGGLAVFVVPPSGQDAAAKRVSGITVDVGPWGQDGAEAFGAWDAGRDLAITLDGTPPDAWLPDPCDLPSGSSVIGLYGVDNAI